MNQQLNHLPLHDLARLCAAFHKDLGGLVDEVSSLEERLGHLELEFLRLVEKLGLLPTMQTETRLADKLEKPSLITQRILKEKAQIGLNSAKVVPQPDGHGLLHLNGQKSVRLTPELATLAAILIDERGKSPDQLIPWHSQRSVVDALLLQTGRSFSKKAVHQLVYRLRELLTAHGENRFFVMSDRLRGYRFALRRSQAGVTPPLTTEDSPQ